MANDKKHTLLEKYGIPIDHLDFDYIKKSQNVKEIERMVEILKSGEEGFYPDLTLCAENKLKELSPNNRLLRVEEPIHTKRTMKTEEWDQLSNMIEEFTTDIKTKDGLVRIIDGDGDDPFTSNLLPVREALSPDDGAKPINKSSNRIQSCDYDKWDRYDADTEVLKMDLTEERNREREEIINKVNLEKAKIEVIKPSVIDGLSKIEKEQLSEKHRILGNEYFKAADFVEALTEYSKSLNFCPTANAFNNRAMTNIKLAKYPAAIADCDNCLRIEPKNVKALLRKAQALKLNEKLSYAYEVYLDALKVEPDNAMAIKNVAQIKIRVPELPPANAYRMTIVERNQMEENVDLSKLVVPKKIVKSKLALAAESLNGLAENAKIDLKKMQVNLSKKKQVEIFPKPHEGEQWKGAIIEEIYD